MNTKTRKIIAMILGLALTISLFGGVTVFAAGTVTVGIEAIPATVAVGSDVTVKASITAMASAVDGIVAYSVMIKYDKDRFTYVADSDLLLQGTKSPAGDYIIGDGNLTLNNKADVGELYVVYIDTFKGPLDGNNKPTATLPLTVGGLFSVKFTAKTGANPATDFILSGISATQGQNFVDNSATDNAVAETYSPATAAVTVTSARVVNSITLKTAPTKSVYLIGKTTYNVGEALDLTGGVITVNYSSAPLTEDVSITSGMVSGYNQDTQTVGTAVNTVTVTHLGKTTSFDVTVMKLGDVNNDGNINSTDALQTSRGEAKLITLTLGESLAADVNRDALINSTDALNISKFEAKIITSF